MDTVRIGIIGMGNIGKHHAAYLLEGKVSRCQLTAVCSTSPVSGKGAAPGCGGQIVVG